MVLGPPLWPAGHLPLKGGDQMSPRLSPIAGVASRAPAPKLPISPLEGEMAGRPEGGAWAQASTL
ncbi:lytic murein transglycosylase [Mesorhizobium sp. B2-7-2]|nr:lytic murein transglycosylase [Mesorhizobium sp. B2-7-2]TPJ75284.1 lytic murein transglycosylase [Mesorhizobium sp. B2-6-2]